MLYDLEKAVGEGELEKVSPQLKELIAKADPDEVTAYVSPEELAQLSPKAGVDVTKTVLEEESDLEKILNLHEAEKGYSLRGKDIPLTQHQMDGLNPQTKESLASAFKTNPRQTIKQVNPYLFDQVGLSDAERKSIINSYFPNANAAITPSEHLQSLEARLNLLKGKTLGGIIDTTFREVSTKF